MRIFYDCEFIEDGRSIDLISIGMVAEDDRELYRIVRDDTTIQRAVANDWLRENVVPHLPVKLDVVGTLWDWDTDTDDWLLRTRTRSDVEEAVHRFIGETREPELWAWYGAYDHVAYAQLFGPMVNLPEGFPMWTNDLRQEVHRLGDPELPKQDGAEHNALSDAWWVRSAYEWLMGRSG